MITQNMMADALLDALPEATENASYIMQSVFTHYLCAFLSLSTLLGLRYIITTCCRRTVNFPVTVYDVLG